MILTLQNLSFLRTLADWRRTLDQGERSISSRLVPFTTANGSVIYRKPAQTTTTVAQPKKTIPKQTPANLQQAGWFKNLFVSRKQSSVKEAQYREATREVFINWDREYSDHYIESTWDTYNSARISQLNPLVQIPAAAFINKVDSEFGIKLRIGKETFRTFAEQDALYAIGRTVRKNEKIVTSAKGGQSYHNYGLALDVFIVENGKIKAVTPEVAALGKECGFEWGGDWPGKTNDPPHFQMTLEYSIEELQKSYNSDNYKTIIHKNDNKKTITQ